MQSLHGQVNGTGRQQQARNIINSMHAEVASIGNQQIMMSDDASIDRMPRNPPPSALQQHNEIGYVDADIGLFGNGTVSYNTSAQSDTWQGQNNGLAPEQGQGRNFTGNQAIIGVPNVDINPNPKIGSGNDGSNLPPVTLNHVNSRHVIVGGSAAAVQPLTSRPNKKK